MDNLTMYRLANAKEKLESAKLLLDAGKYKDSIGRSGARLWILIILCTIILCVMENDIILRLIWM